MLASIETTSPSAANMVVRLRAVIGHGSASEFRQSFQVPALENQNRPAQRHRRIEQCIKRVLPDELRAHMLFMRRGTDDVECREIRHQVRRTGGYPSGETVRHGRETPQVFGKAANHEQRKGEYRGE